jgi:hypothetical protein
MMERGYCVLNSKEELVMLVDGLLSAVWLLITEVNLTYYDVMRNLCTYTVKCLSELVTFTDVLQY